MMPKNNNPIYGIYLNGLNNGVISPFEKYAIKRASRNNFRIKHVSINWVSGVPFGNIVSLVTKEAEAIVDKHGSIIIIGASAAGSLAINAYESLKHKECATVITLCSRICEPKLAWWDKRSLKNMAHIGKKNESQSFYDSVMYCSEIALPRLAKDEKNNIINVKQWADEIVPKRTMHNPQLQEYIVPAIGHHIGIVLGILHIKYILKSTRNPSACIFIL